MQRFILFVLIFLFGKVLLAQQERYILPLPDNTFADKGLQQPSPSTATMTNSMFELIDLTGDSLVLGYLLSKDGDNNRIAITTPLLKSEWLLAAVEDNMSATFASRGANGLYILNDLSTGVTDGGNYVRIKANVYESAPGANAYRLLNNIDTFIVTGNKNLSSLSSDLVSVIGGTLLAAKGGIVGKTPANAIATKDAVIRTEQEKYAFISNGIIPTGIYMTYNDFKSIKPSFGQFYIKTDTVSKTIEVNAFTQGDSTLRPVMPWAVAVNGELYYYSGNKLYAVEAVGSNLVFSKFLDPLVRTNNAGFWRMTVGDLLGEKYKNPFDNVNTLKINNYRNRGISGEAIKVNADTGAPEL